MDSLILHVKKLEGETMDAEKIDRLILLLIESGQLGVDISSLPTEILYEIFFRLPSFKPVCRFRCVSKLWNSLLSEPSFIDKISNILISKIPWILMYDPSNKQTQLYRNQDIHKLINGRLSFEFLVDTIYPFNKQELEKACILDSCSNGLVLYTPRSVGYHLDSVHHHTFLYICNPLTEQWVSLPRRPYNASQEKYHQCTKLVCEKSLSSLGHPSVCNYKVVYVYDDVLGDDLNFQIFSSETGKWKTFPSPRELWKPRELLHKFSEMVIRHGVLYWTAQVSGTDERILLGYSTLENNENGRDRCRSMALPKKRDDIYVAYHDNFFHSFFGESEGSIFYYGQIEQTIYETAFLSLWLIDQDYTNGGLFYWQIVHKNIELTGYRSSRIEFVCINPVDPNVIIILEQGCFLAYNVTTQKYEVLHGSPVPKTSKHRYKPTPILIRPRPTVIPPLSS